MVNLASMQQLPMGQVKYPGLVLFRKRLIIGPPHFHLERLHGVVAAVACTPKALIGTIQ